MKFLLFALLFGAVYSNEEFRGWRRFAFPEFLTGANQTVIQEWMEIMRKSEPVSQIQQEQTTFGTKYGLSAQVASWQANFTSWENQLQQNITAVIANLTNLQNQVSAIYRNTSLSYMQMGQAVRVLIAQNEATGDALMCITRAIIGHQGQGFGGGQWVNGWNGGGQNPNFGAGGQPGSTFFNNAGGNNWNNGFNGVMNPIPTGFPIYPFQTTNGAPWANSGFPNPGNAPVFPNQQQVQPARK